MTNIETNEKMIDSILVAASFLNPTKVITHIKNDFSSLVMLYSDWL